MVVRPCSQLKELLVTTKEAFISGPDQCEPMSIHNISPAVSVWLLSHFIDLLDRPSLLSPTVSV